MKQLRGCVSRRLSLAQLEARSWWSYSLTQQSQKVVALRATGSSRVELGDKARMYAVCQSTT
jgi:hypothetical protein